MTSKENYWVPSSRLAFRSAIKTAISEAVAVERERCAKVCEEQISGTDYLYLATHGHWDIMAQAAVNCAAAIRKGPTP